MAEVRFWCLCIGSPTAALWEWAAAVSAGVGYETEPWASEVSPQADFSGFSPHPGKQVHAHTHCWIGVPAPGLLSYKGCFKVWAAGATCTEPVLRCLLVNQTTNQKTVLAFGRLLSAAINPFEIIWQQRSERINWGFAGCWMFFLRHLSVELVDSGD